MLLFTGLRKGDVCRLRWEKVHLEGTKEFKIPQLMRHNFATHPRMAGLTNEEIKRVTGYAISQFNELGATLGYVTDLATTNKPLFEKVEQGIVGDLYDDLLLDIDPLDTDSPSADEAFDIVVGGYVDKS